MIVCLSWMGVSLGAAQVAEPVQPEQGWLVRWQAGEAVSESMAVDLNPLYNPCVKKRPDGSLFVSPEAGCRYADRSASLAYMIQANDLCCRLFKAHGFRWGGDWSSLKDYQHFEKP